MSKTTTTTATHSTQLWACILCRQRRLKCDRKLPCSRCVKSQVECKPSIISSSRKRRPHKDLQERLARFEELLDHYTGNGVSLPGVSAQIFKEDEKKDILPRGWQPNGRAFEQNGSIKFTEGIVWATIWAELDEMKTILETQDALDNNTLGFEALDLDDSPPSCPGHPTYAVQIRAHHPAPLAVFRLWHIFLERVNPLTKVVHVPSLEQVVIEAATHIEKLKLSHQALLFAIYTMATVAMTEEECCEQLELSRYDALQRFTAGTKLALVKLNFIKNHDMETLQALLLHLLSLKGRYDDHALWVLSGTVIRIAQKMGYHRDGEYLGLSPFETEMRRRLWWQIVIQDAKHNCVSGLSDGALPVHGDTKSPSNVNDADMIPTSTLPIVSQDGPTEMSFCMVAVHMYRYLVKEDSLRVLQGLEHVVLGQELNGTNNSAVYDGESIRKYQSFISEFDEHLIQAEKKYFKPGQGGFYSIAMSIRPNSVNKFKAMLIPMHQQEEWGTEIFDGKDNLFKIVVMNNEQDINTYESVYKDGLSWFAGLDFHMDSCAMITTHLCQRPIGPLADRAWNVVDKLYAYNSQLFDITRNESHAQARVTLQAWEEREAAMKRMADHEKPTRPTPLCVARLRHFADNCKAASCGRGS